LRVLLVFAVLLVLVMAVSSVSANVIISPPAYPDSVPGGSVSPEEGIASPILFGNGAASGAEAVVSSPPTEPESAPPVESNGGTIITIIVTTG
jgi:hypothetical protein